METINNVAAAASKAIWGDQQTTTQGNETAGTEPISGQTGKGTVNEPYDQGNSVNPISTTTHPTSNTISSNTTSANTTTLPDRTADKMTSNTSNTFGSSDPTGPHDTHTANKLDPRIDSDHAGSYGNTTGGALTGNTTGGGLTGNTHSHGSDPTGPYDSHLGNKADPRVDSDRIGSQGNTTGGGLTGNTFSSNTSGGLSGNTHSHGSDPTGPHDSHLGNKADPRVDSDRIGSQGNTTGGGLTGNTHSSNTSGGLTGSNHTHGSDPTGPHDSHLGNKADPRVDSDRIGSQGNTTGGLTGNTHSSHTTPSSIPTNPNSAATGGAPKPHQNTDKTGVVGGHGDPFKTTGNVASESKPNTGAPSSDAGLTKQQGAANPNDEPTGHQKSAVKEGKDDAEDFLRTKDPNDHSGEPMHMHTGAGDRSAVPKTQEERRESKIGNPGGQEHGKETSEGTGEQWVKTSGMAADGGDFDATKPGAGREADRLMEQKGIHKTEPGKPSEPLAETSSHGSHSHGEHGEKEKVPIGQKIKEKLHIGSKDK